MNGVRPTIIVTCPHNCEECVSIYRTIKVMFHESVYPAVNYKDIKVIDSHHVEVKVKTCIYENTLFIDICGSLDYDTKYYVVIPKDCVKDLECNLFCPEYVFEFTTEINKNLLFITRTEPQNEDKCVDINTNIVINFNKIIKEGKEFDDIKLISCDGKCIKIKKEICESALKIDLCEELEYEKEYKLFIPKCAVKDCKNITMEKSYTLEFTTEEEKKLFVVCTKPVDGAGNVDTCEEIVITFNSKIEEGKDFCEIKLFDNQGECVELEKVIKGDRLYLEPEKLCQCKKYFLEIPKKAVKSCEGKTLQCDFNMSFCTVCLVKK